MWNASISRLLRDLSPEVRREVLRRVRRGEAVRDPEHAELAIEVAREFKEAEEGWTKRLYAFVFAAMGAWILVNGVLHGPWWRAVIGLAFIAVVAVVEVGRPRRVRRYEEAQRVNAQIALPQDADVSNERGDEATLDERLERLRAELKADRSQWE